MVSDTDVDADFIKLARDRKVIIIPTLVVNERYYRTFGASLNLLPAELRFANPAVVGTLTDIRHLSPDLLPARIKQAMSEPERNERAIQLVLSIVKRNLKALFESGVTVAAGTDAGNIGTLHGPSIFREFVLMTEAGLTPMQILACATANGARVFGPNANTGEIAAGKLADLVILRANPLEAIGNTANIQTVIKGGDVYDADTLIEQTPEEVVQRQVNAFNAHNVEVYLSTYAPEAKFSREPDQIRETGPAAIRQSLEKEFAASPSLHLQVVKRTVTGNTVVDHVAMIRATNPRKPEESVLTYEVSGGLIRSLHSVTK